MRRAEDITFRAVTGEAIRRQNRQDVAGIRHFPRRLVGGTRTTEDGEDREHRETESRGCSVQSHHVVHPEGGRVVSAGGIQQSYCYPIRGGSQREFWRGEPRPSQ